MVSGWEGASKEVASEQREGVMRIPGGGQIQQRGRQEQRCGLEQAAFLGTEAEKVRGVGGIREQ